MNRAHLLLAIPLSCLLLTSVGCGKGHDGPAPPPPAPSAPGHIYVYRPAGSSVVTLSLVINRLDVGPLAAGDVIAVEKPPGSYDLAYKCSVPLGASCNAASAKLNISLKPGESRYIRTDVKGWVPPTVVSDEIAPEQGEREVTNIRNSSSRSE